MVFPVFINRFDPSPPNHLLSFLILLLKESTLSACRGRLSSDFVPSTPSEINSPTCCWNPLPCCLSFSIFSLLCRQVWYEFWGWYRCQGAEAGTFQRDLLTSRWPEYKGYVTSELNWAKHIAVASEDICRKAPCLEISRLGLGASRPIGQCHGEPHLMPGLSCSHGMTWMVVMSVECQPPSPRFCYLPTVLGSQQEARSQLASLQVVFCVFSPQDTAFYKVS